MKMTNLIFLTGVLVFGFFGLSWSMIDYDGYSLFQVFPDTEAKVEYLTGLSGKENQNVQIWRDGSTTSSFDIMISPKFRETFEKQLSEKDIRFEVPIENLRRSIESEKKPVPMFHRALSGLPNAAQFSKYLTLDEVNAFIQSLAKQYPSLVKLSQLGTSYEKRPIYMVKIGSDVGKNKPSFWIEGGIHAREWLTVATVLYFINKMATGYASDSKIKSYVDKIDWYMVPVLNVDGYVHTHTKDRMWRKNRRPAPSCFRCCDGVDLNRNFNVSFGGPGTVTDTCQDSYAGAQAFSEPETQAIRDFVLKNANSLKAFIDIHAYSQMWFYPYSYQKKTYPDDVQELVALSNKAAEAMKAPYGTEMRVGTPADILYAATGSTMDWVKLVAKVKYAFAMELRPSNARNGNGFLLPPSNIVPAGEETWAGISVVADEVIKKFGK